MRNLNFDVADLKLVSIDQVAVDPLKPIKPKKALILALGVVLGGMLGLFIALLRNMLRRKPDAFALANAARESAHSL
ncbi:G-rich domain on putative tyrosine kinase [compost metagenome]